MGEYFLHVPLDKSYLVCYHEYMSKCSHIHLLIPKVRYPMTPNENKHLCHTLDEHNTLVSEVKATLPTEEEFSAAAELFKAFDDPTRLRILATLASREICVCDIAEVLGMTQSAISHQLRALRQIKLIKSRRQGRTVYYSLADDHVVSILACATDHIRES